MGNSICNRWNYDINDIYEKIYKYRAFYCLRKKVFGLNIIKENKWVFNCFEYNTKYKYYTKETNKCY